MMSQQTLLKTGLLLTLLAMTSACSQSLQPTGNYASRAAPDTTSSGTLTSTGTLADCNQKSQGGITANLMIYTDSSGKIRDDYMKLKLLQVPSDFANGAYFEFFRWKAGANGQPSLDTTPTQARFETLDGKVLTEFAPVIYWGQVAKIASDSQLSDPASFLKYVRLVIDIRDTNYEYDVLKIAYYSSTNQILNDMDMLLPSFSVNPVDYALDHGTPRPAFLTALHPFATTGGMATEQLKATTQTYCF